MRTRRASTPVPSSLPCMLVLGLLLGVCFPDGADALQEFGATSTGDLRVSADYCTFRGDSLSSYVEIYFQVMLSELEFRSSETGGVLAEVAFDAYVEPEGGQKALLRSWSMPVRLGSADDARRPGLSLYDVIDAALEPGLYALDVVIRDIHSGKEGSLTLPITVRAYPAGLVTLSDVQLARSIERVEGDPDIWVKNGYRIMPNPSRRYGKALPTLRSYCEVYGLGDPALGTPMCTVRYEVQNVEGATVQSKGPFLLRKAGTSNVLVGDVDVAALDPGFYRLTLTVCDTATFALDHGAHASAFFIRAEEIADGGSPRGLSEAESTAAEIELRFIGSPSEVKRFRELTPVGRTLYLDKLWKTRDPDPATVQNEARLQLHQRIAVAQNRFREMGREGMDTDRGRVFIKYGPPTEITRLSGELTCKDHEIWEYRQEREWQFVFFDETGSSSYRLIHSNYPGEVSRPDWEKIVCETQRMQTF